MTSFAEAASTHVLSELYDINGIHVFRIPCVGQLSYLSALDIETQSGKIDRVQMSEANGMPIAQLRTEALALLDNRIQFEQGSDARGCLPNMNAAAAYTLRIEGQGQIKVTYHGRQLPAPPDPQLPPLMGLMNCFNEIWGYQFTRGLGDRVQPMYRVGNWLRKLWVIFKDADANPLEVTHDVLQWDDRLVPPGPFTYYPDGRAPKTIDVNYTKKDTGVYLWEFPEGLPRSSTYFGPRWHSTQDGTVSFIVQDEIRPAPRHMGRPV